MFRGYDFPKLFREDTIKRVRWICGELSKLQAEIEAQKSEESDDDSYGEYNYEAVCNHRKENQAERRS